MLSFIEKRAYPMPRWNLKNLWIGLWAVMLFAPSIMLSFTATESKFSAASVIAAIYLAWRLLFRPLPRMTGATAIAFVLMVDRKSVV